MTLEHGQKSVRTSDHILVYERKFDIALRSTHALSALAALRQEDITTVEKKLLHTHLQYINKSADDIIANSNIYPVILERLWTSHSNSQHSSIRRMTHIIERCLRLQFNALYKRHQHVVQPKLEEYATRAMTEVKSSKEIMACLDGFHTMTEVIDKLPVSDARRLRKTDEQEKFLAMTRQCSYTWKEIDVEFRWTRNSCLVRIVSQWYIAPRTYLLLIHNKISDLLSVLVLAAVTPDSNYGAECLSTTVSFVRELNKLAIQKGQKFFSISKVLEAIVIGETLKRVEGRGNAQFLATVTDSLLEDRVFNYEGSRLQEVLQGTTVAMMHELACLSKLMGHPYCDMRETAEDLLAKTREPRLVNIPMVQDAVRHAKQDFVKTYIMKTGKWPPVQLDPGAREVLTSAVAQGIDPGRATHQNNHGVLHLRDWDSVEILKCEEFNRLENFIPYVKDRTVALTRSKVFLKYFAEDNKEPYRVDWKETRALLAYLMFPYKDTEHLSYLELYANSDWEAMLDLLVIRLVPKEKEHKVKARCFGCKPPQERARTIVLGHNASKFLHRYCDSEAMTLSELTLTRKLAAFRNMYHAYKNYAQIIICLDASRWNSRLRDAALAPIAHEVLDGVYGETMFGQFHTTYQHMFLFLPDAEEIHHWEGQDGGIEGLDQYVWVHSYIAHLKTVLSRFGYPFQLLVKGDDARVVILIPPQRLRNRTIEALRAELVEEITRGATEFGHLMKPEDCYGSQVYCAFSKNAFIRNTEQPQSFRKCQKAYGANNAFLNTLDDYVASSFSNCHSTAKTSPSPIACYVLALWWMLIALLKHPMYASMKDAALTALTLIPNVLGGFPIIFLHNFYQRAESDLLSSYVEIYLQARRCDSEIREILDNVWIQKVLDPQDNIELLCMDPYALPLYKPPQAQSILRRHLRTTISQLTENRLIRDLFRARRSDLHDTVVSALVSMNIYNPKIMSTIFSCTPEGIIMELVTKFESGKSVLDAIILRKHHRKGNKILREATRADVNLHLFRQCLLAGRIHGGETVWVHDGVCSAHITQNMRERLWKRSVEAITQPAVFHLVTIGDLSWHLADRSADSRHFEVKWQVPETSKEGTIFAEGPFTAFLGDSTSKGLTHPEVKIMSENIFAIKIIKLMEVYKWSVPTEQVPEKHMSVSELCAQIIRRYTNRPIEDLLPFTCERPYGKTTQHHLRANQFRPSIIPNTLQNVYTWTQVNMLTHLELTGNPSHYRLNFHEIKCWVTSVMASRSWIGMIPPPNGTYWAVTTTCEFCLAPLHEQSLWCSRYSIPHIDLYEHFEEARKTVQDINKEIEEFSPEMYLISDQNDTNVTPVMAAFALCQYSCDTEWDSQRTFEDTVTGHTVSARGREMLQDWTGGGKRSIVSFEDLRYVPINIIFESLVPMIVGTITHRFPMANRNNVGAILSSIPAEMLPWTCILNHLHHLHRVRELQDYVSRKLREGAMIMDNYLTYSSRFGAQCYLYWTLHPTDSLSMTVMTNRDDTEVRRILRTRLKAYRRALFCQTYNTYGDDRESQEIKERRSLELIIATARYEAFDHQYELTRGIYHEITATELHIINISQDLDISDIILDVDRDSPRAFARLSARFSGLPISQTLALVRDLDEVVLELMTDLDQDVIRKFVNIPIRITKIDVLTCKNKVKEYEANRPRIPRPLNQNEAWMADITWTVTGHRVNIRPFAEHMRRLAIEDIYADEFKNYLSTPLTPLRVTGDAWNNRPLGAFNISMTRYAYVLHQLGIRSLGERRFIVCFADGYGGATKVLSRFVTNSQFLFVTSPTTSGENPIPYGIENDGRGNKVLTNPITLGRWDLRDTSNLLALEQDYQYQVDFCVCDAELPHNDQASTGYSSIWTNVVRYWLRNASESGILVLKVYFMYYDLILRLISLMRPHCATCYVIQSEGSSWNNEIFIIAVRAEACMDDYHPLPKLYPPSIRVRCFSSYWAAYIRAFQEEQAAPDRVEVIKTFPVKIQELCRVLPSYGWSQIEMIIRTGIRMYVFRYRRNEDMDDHRARILQILTTQLSMMEREALGEQPLDMSSMGALYRTRTHQIEVLYKVMILRGFKEVLMINSNTNRYITATSIRDKFLETLPQFAAVHPAIREPYGAFWTVPILLHEKYDLRAAWLQGTRWGLAAKSWAYATRTDND